MKLDEDTAARRYVNMTQHEWGGSPEQTRKVFAEWWQCFQSSQVTAKDISDACDKRLYGFSKQLLDAFEDVDLAPPPPGRALNTRSLGAWLRKRLDDNDADSHFKLGRSEITGNWFLFVNPDSTKEETDAEK